MNTKIPDETITAWARLIRTQRALLDTVEAALKAEKLPPLSWYDVLLELKSAEGGKLRQFEIGNRILLSKHNLSRLLDRLQQQGLVQREECVEDKRGAYVKITVTGIALLKKMWPVYARCIEAHFARHLDRNEMITLSALLGKLLAQAE